MRFATLALLFATFATLLPAHSQHREAEEPTEEEPIEVMLLGTVHLDNPGRDLNNPTVPDVTAPEKQRELEAIRNALAQFGPTKIAIEVRRHHQAALDSLYGAFRAGRTDSSFAVGDFASRRSEHYQLGFRLAKRLGHERLWAVDHFEVGMDFERVLAYARERDTSFVSYMQRFEDGPLMTEIDSLLQQETLQDLYRFLNRPETVQRFRAPNARMATVAGDTSYVGTDVVAQYHKRNLRIFANIEEIAEAGDRILVTFGAGHMPYLRPLVEASPQMKLVSPLRYL